MFGFVLPAKSELKIREYEQFKACYCGLCHTLGKKYGFVSRLILNYDFTFLAMLLWQKDTPFCILQKRCIASPLKKKCLCAASSSLETAAGYSVILAYWKEKDEVADESFFKGLKARFVLMFLKRAYKKASKDYPDFDRNVKSNLARLSLMEKERENSVDKTADAFARILSSAADNFDDELHRRASEQLLYHLGRWIYLIDAYNDLDEDIKKGRYNPIVERFGKDLSDEAAKSLKETIIHSQNLMGSAFELMDASCWHSIIENIIYYGIPQICEDVFIGTYKKNQFPIWTGVKNERSL